MTLVQPKQIRSTNAFFTAGSTAFPALLALGTATITLSNVAPRVAADVLAAGECITVTPASALPQGLNIAYAIVTANNTVVIGVSATVAILAGSMAWTICAHR